MGQRIKRVSGALVMAACMLAALAAPTMGSASVGAAVSGIQRHGVFDEPLVAFRTPTAKERLALESAIAAYRAEGGPARIDPLRHYLELHPRSPWKASLLLNMGLARMRAGYFSDAVALLQAAREEAGTDASTQAAQAVAGRILGESLRLHTRFGHRERLADSLRLAEKTPVTGAASEAIAMAREGLWQMRGEPQEALCCGIIAVESLLRAQDPEAPGLERLAQAKSSEYGTRFDELERLAPRRVCQPAPFAVRRTMPFRCRPSCTGR